MKSIFIYYTASSFNNPIRIVTQDNEGKEVNCKLNDVIDVFETNHEKKSNDLLIEINNTHTSAFNLQRNITEEYRILEAEFIKQEAMIDVLKDCKLNKEKNLRKFGVLF